MDLLPADVLADVLGRLPPQSLAACRCVCTDWRDFVNGRDTLRLSLLPVKVAGMFLLLSGTPGLEFFARPTPVGTAIPRSIEYLPQPNHLVSRVRSHCNGIIAVPGVVVNPATRQWSHLPPPPPCPEISALLFCEHLVFDPTISRHYEVLLIPVVPTVSHYDAVFITETAEWPPSQFSLRIFSSKLWQWDERTFLREGKSAGTVADMRLLQEEIVYGRGKMHQSVYWDGALYASCGGNFFIRISMLSGKYQVIKPPIGIQLSEYPVLHLGRSKKEVCCALIHDRCRLQTWFLKESSGQMEWLLKHQVDFGFELTQCEYGNQIHGPWMLYDDDDDFTCQVQEKFVHESHRPCDSVYDGENCGQDNKDENNCHDESGEDFGYISDHEEDDEYCQVPLQFEWDSDNDNIIDSKDVVTMRSNEDITFLGFHPSKEIVFLHVSSTRGVAYHFNGAKVQDLGELVFSDFDYVQQSFVYTPCRMTLP